jgi:protein-tyrosine phosphatase
VIDVHCHYLPQVDDGAQTFDESLALLRLAWADGVTKVVLTPHLFAGRWENTRSSLQPKFRALCDRVRSENIPLELFLGGEVRLQPELLQLVSNDDIPYIGGWSGFKVLLLELEDGRIPVGAINGVRYLKRQGVLPMLAHPERNKAVMDDWRVLQPFLAEGCLLQLTAASVVGDFGRRAEAASRKLLELGWPTLVASDAHNLIHRPPLMSRARALLSARYGEATARELTELAPGRIVAARAQFALDTEPGQAVPNR